MSEHPDGPRTMKRRRLRRYWSIHQLPQSNTLKLYLPLRSSMDLTDHRESVDESMNESMNESVDESVNDCVDGR